VAFPRLQYVKACGKDISDASLQALAVRCPQLRVVEIAGSDKLTDDGVRALIGGCPNLGYLALPFCKQLTGTVFENVNDNSSSMALATSSSSLSSSASSSFPFSTTIEMSKPLIMPNLQYLDLSRCLNVNDGTLERLAQMCHNLVSLNLTACEDVTDGGLVAIARACSKLKSVTLSRCVKVTDVAVGEFARSCGSGLVSLSLDNCHLITDASLVALGKNCGELTELDLSCCEKVTDEGLKQLGMGLCGGRLEKLSLEEVTQVTNEGLKGIGEWGFNLKGLRLAYCRGLEDAALLELARGCPKLTSLDLSYCGGVTREGIQAALDLWTGLKVLNLRGAEGLVHEGLSHPRLQVLNLSWSKNVEDGAVEGIASGCPSLVSLDLAWCNKVTGKALHEVNKRCTGLRSVNLRGCTKINFVTVRYLVAAGKIVYK